MKARKLKVCRVCGAEFTPYSSLAKACSVICAMTYSARKEKEEKERERRKYVREGREKLKTLSGHVKTAQQAFNSYIRARDSGKPCVSCDKPDNGQHQRHASHYRSAGRNAKIRFNTYNVHASCATCNCMESGNLIEYRIRLIDRIGLERVEWLEREHGRSEFTREYLSRLAKVFNRRARLTRARIGV